MRRTLRKNTHVLAHASSLVNASGRCRAALSGFPACHHRAQSGYTHAHSSSSVRTSSFTGLGCSASSSAGRMPIPLSSSKCFSCQRGPRGRDGQLRIIGAGREVGVVKRSFACASGNSSRRVYILAHARALLTRERLNGCWSSHPVK